MRQSILRIFRGALIGKQVLRFKEHLITKTYFYAISFVILKNIFHPKDQP